MKNCWLERRESKTFEISIPEIKFPNIVIPDIKLPEGPIQLPPIIFVCLDVPAEIPLIYNGPPINITLGPIPTEIKLSGFTIPERIQVVH